MSRFLAMAMRITVHCAIVELCSLRWSTPVFCLICKPTKIKETMTPTEATIWARYEICSNDIGSLSAVRSSQRSRNMALMGLTNLSRARRGCELDQSLIRKRSSQNGPDSLHHLFILQRL